MFLSIKIYKADIEKFTWNNNFLYKLYSKMSISDGEPFKEWLLIYFLFDQARKGFKPLK